MYLDIEITELFVCCVIIQECFCRLTTFFIIDFLLKNYFRNTIIVSNVLSGLIWVQTVCKDYLQTSKFAACRQ